ncbi:MAG: hypothetical protein HKN23_04120 [Verrucomicrobiales bacterium]|nr:hypothetical protein [Verrucomicrobiales bacterium]
MKDGFEATSRVVRVLEDMDIDYLVVGSLSSMAYGIPRSTKDADLVLSLKSGELSRFADALGPEFELDPQGSFETVTGTMRYHLGVPSISFEIELFLLSDDAHDQARFERRQTIFSPQLESEAPIPTAEDVIVMKIRWAEIGKRGKDRDDVRDIIAVQGDDALDWDYIHKWTAEHGTRKLLDEIRESIPPIDD